MAATTISRATITDDSGSGTDGTIINSAWVGTAIYDKVDALFSGTGVTFNQGTSWAAILSFESSNVAHGMTDVRGTAVYGACARVGDSTGGLLIDALTEDVVALKVRACATNDDTTKSTAGTAPITLDGNKKSGTSIGAVGANANVLVVSTAGTARFILDGDGDSHQDVGTAWTNFDDHDDVALLTAVSGALSRLDDPLRAGFVAALEEHRDTLERAKLVTFNADGHHFVNWSRMSMLLIGALRQLGGRLAALESAELAR